MSPLYDRTCTTCGRTAETLESHSAPEQIACDCGEGVMLRNSVQRIGGFRMAEERAPLLQGGN